jgi:hypothetical protein
MTSNAFDDTITLTRRLPIAITVSELPAPINREARDYTHNFVEERFEAVMERRREFIEQFEKDTGLELDATRRDSVAEVQHPASLAMAQHGAVQLLLEAWYEWLGVNDDGWTRYNEKTTARACRTMREILEKGDEELGIPIEALEDREGWIRTLDSTKWWFFNLSGAYDFLAAYGIGINKFGCGHSRVEILNYCQNGKCISGDDHGVSMLAWHQGNNKVLPGRFPPMRPCGCYEYRLLMKTIGNAKGLPAAGDFQTLTAVGAQIANDWLAANEERAFDTNGWPKSAEDQNPAVVMMGEERFEMRYYEGNDGEEGISLRAVRVEGRFGELL